MSQPRREHEPEDWSRLRHLFRSALDGLPVPPGPHPLEDDELLACWSQGQLSPAQNERFLDHLSHCSLCRRELVALYGEDLAEEPGVLRTRAGFWRQRSRVLLAAAAGILVVLLPLAYWSWPPGKGNPQLAQEGDPQLAQAEADLRGGQSEAVIERLAVWLEQHPDGPERSRALQLLEQAGAQAALAELKQGHYQRVRTLTARVNGLGAVSARLDNLRLQAGRGQPVEVALARFGGLLSYGYEIDGEARGKGLPIVDDRADQQWLDALKAHPEDAVLKINYGQFLLSQARADESSRYFAEVLKRGLCPVEAQLGLGLAAFEQRNYEGARRHFQAAVDADPRRLEARVNLAMTLDQLKQPDGARPHWLAAHDLTDNPALRRRIRNQLQPRND
jgi:tetratricopeptide (TPR) repeat protein